METRNGKYREMIWIGNRPVKSPFFKRKTDAAMWKANKLNERTKMQVLGDEYKTQTKITFYDFALNWLETKIRPAKSPNTYREYESILRCHLTPLLGNIPLKDIKIKEADSQDSLSDFIDEGRPNYVGTKSPT